MGTRNVGNWLREVGDWLLENPLGADLLGQRNDFMEAADEFDRLYRAVHQPVLLSDWQKLEAERDRYRVALQKVRCRLIEVNSGVPGLDPNSIDAKLIDTIDEVLWSEPTATTKPFWSEPTATTKPFCLTCCRLVAQCSCKLPSSTR